MSAKVIKKKLKLPSEMTGDLNEMFNQMLGTGSVNINVAFPRYNRINALVHNCLKIFKTFTCSAFMNHPELATNRSEIDSFIGDTASFFAARKISIDVANTSAEERDTFAKYYSEIKESKYIKMLIATCNVLCEYKKDLTAERPNLKFIANMNLAEWRPLVFSGINFKYIVSVMNISDSTSEFLSVLLSKILSCTREIYTEVYSPDIDIDEFVNIILHNIEIVKKHPGLSRCDKAFAKIKKSVKMLKHNFNDYYQDFLSTRKSSIIMEHFILDVSKNTDADAETLRQFNKIIKYYRDAASNISDPKMKEMFEKVNESFNEISKQTANITKDDDVKDSNVDNHADKQADNSDIDINDRAADNQVADKDAAERSANASKSVDELVKMINGESARITKK